MKVTCNDVHFVKETKKFEFVFTSEPDQDVWISGELRMCCEKPTSYEVGQSYEFKIEG